MDEITQLSFCTEKMDHSFLIQLSANERKVLSIAPFQGAKIIHLDLLQNKKWHNILWEVAPVELKNNVFGKNDILFPFPNRLDGGMYEYQVEKYHFPINEPENNNAIHGFLREEVFEILETSTGDDWAQISLIHQSQGKPYFPFPFDFIVEYHWHLHGVFKVSFNIRNTGRQSFPFGVGWHPYFDIGTKGLQDVCVSLPHLREYPVNQRYLPTGETRNIPKHTWEPENVFFNATYEILSKKNSFLIQSEQLKLKISTSDNLPFLQVYAPPGQGVVALEPMSCGINAFHNKMGLRELEPGDFFQSEVCLKVV